ncbi:uncharacterized protein [Antedon mediterranea]|uniref:uncharacterized protein n=1 Tax=Antedon mediterranea TaxID=105859 RepID=UPI003AF5AA2C
MASKSSNDEHTSLKNELIFLSKLLHQHKQKNKEKHTTQQKQKSTQSSHKYQSKTLLPPCKKNMVWRRADDVGKGKQSDHYSNVSAVTLKHSGQFSKVNNMVTSTATLASSTLNPSKNTEKYTKVNNSVTQSTTLSSYHARKQGNYVAPSAVYVVKPLVKANHLEKSEKLKYVTQSTKVATTSTPFDQTKNSGKYSKINTKTFNQSDERNSTINYKNESQQKTSPSNLTKVHKNATHTFVNDNHLTNKTEIAKEIKDELTNHKYSQTKSLNTATLERNLKMDKTYSTTTNKSNPSPKNNPNSKYVWKKEKESLKVKNDRKQTSATHSLPDSPISVKNSNSSASPIKYIHQKQNIAVKTKYKLQLNSPTQSTKKVIKNRKTVYASVYVSPSVKKKKSLGQNGSKKTSKHRWVCDDKKEKSIAYRIKKTPKLPTGTGHSDASYSKSKFTWRKEHPKTKRVSMCGYKLTNVVKTPKTQPKPFMERRKKYVNSHTPVLPRSRFKLDKKRSPAVLQSKNMDYSGIRTPGRIVTNPPSVLFTVRKTRRKIVRKNVNQSSGLSRVSSSQDSEVIPVSISNHEFKVHSSGKKLKRLKKVVGLNNRIASVDKASFVLSKQFISSRKLVAQQVLHKSIITSNQAKYKKHNKVTDAKRYCIYYNHFGKCSRGKECQYVHDPDKVAVCTRFLRGKCKQVDGTCPFSHKVSKDKMPVCSYFLRGICNRDNCPYLHVNVSRNAAICEDFLRGYCPEGEKCKKKHSLECPNYRQDKTCPRGRQCRLLHRQQKTTKRKSQKPEHKIPKRPKQVTEDIEPSSEVENSESNNLPSFISLNNESWKSTPDASILEEYKESSKHVRSFISLNNASWMSTPDASILEEDKETSKHIPSFISLNNESWKSTLDASILEEDKDSSQHVPSFISVDNGRWMSTPNTNILEHTGPHEETKESSVHLTSFISLNNESLMSTPNTSLQDKTVTPELHIRPKFTSK